MKKTLEELTIDAMAAFEAALAPYEAAYDAAYEAALVK